MQVIPWNAFPTCWDEPFKVTVNMGNIGALLRTLLNQYM